MPEVVHWSHEGLTTGRRTGIGPAFGGFEAKLPTPLIPLPGPQWSRATPAQTLPVGHLDRHGRQTDIVEQPRMLTAFAKLMAGSLRSLHICVNEALQASS